jgi:hypothetical protein
LIRLNTERSAKTTLRDVENPWNLFTASSGGFVAAA